MHINAERTFTLANSLGKIMQRKTEIEFMLNYIEEHGIYTILEIGTYWGGTAAVWASIGCAVTTVDVYNNEPKIWDLPEFPVVLAHKPQFVHGNSHDANVLTQLSLKDYDLVIIDGDHEMSAQRDWIYLAPLARKGVAIHDIEEYKNIPLRDNNWWPMCFWQKALQNFPKVHEFCDSDKGNWGIVDMPELRNNHSDILSESYNWFSEGTK